MILGEGNCYRKMIGLAVKMVFVRFLGKEQIWGLPPGPSWLRTCKVKYVSQDQGSCRGLLSNHIDTFLFRWKDCFAAVNFVLVKLSSRH